jgi:hypothetical protein
MIVAGIDPGKNGGIVVCNNKTMNIIGKFTIPKIGKEVDLMGLCRIISTYLAGIPVVLEEPHSIVGTGKGSMFTMGRVLGNIEAALACNGIEYQLVSPKDWQKVVWQPEDIVKVKSKTGLKMVNDTKATSLNAVKRLFPEADFKYGDLEKVSGRRNNGHDGLVDAALISMYSYYVTK